MWFFTYELGYILENRLKPLAQKSFLPFAYFGIYKNVKKSILVPNFSHKENNIYQKFKDFEINIEKEEYVSKIEKIKYYISCGDIYQVNFTFKIKFKFDGDLEALFIHSFFPKDVNMPFL